MIVGLRVGASGIGLRLLLGGCGVGGDLVVTGSGTASQSQGTHCCDESKSSYLGQFVHQCSWHSGVDGDATH